ncbi:hypothetical protein ScPMuIL_006328 [Solemya velum]
MSMSTQSQRALHFVFKIGNRKETAKFYKDILGMKFLRHEEFEEGCEASCNGPYNGKWSKTMVGYGPEDSHFVIELTYNYGIGSYTMGNDFRGLTLHGENVVLRAQMNNYPVTKEGEDCVIKSPDGHRFVIVNKEPQGDPVKKVSLASSDLDKSVDYWNRLCGMEIYSKDEKSAILGYSHEQCKLELIDLGTDVDHATGFGRVAFSCPSLQLSDIQSLMEDEKQSILKPLVSLDTPGKATVDVVILADPDGHEICYVGDEGFRELSKVDLNAETLLNQAMEADKSDEWFAKKVECIWWSHLNPQNKKLERGNWASMYNGIGLQTVRGTGTNGYVQRNLSFVRKHKDHVDYKSEEELKKLDAALLKGPNREILDHERKRKVELKCMEMQELMEEQGYSQIEIENKVSIFRRMLIDKEGVTEATVEKDEFGRPLAKETHQIAEANQEKNARPKGQEEAAKALAMAQKKYAIVRDSSSSERSPSPPTKRKKKSREKSSSSEREVKRKKKSRKHKRDRSENKKHKSRSKHRKNQEDIEDVSEKPKKHRKPVSPSSSSGSSSGSDSDSDSSSEEDKRTEQTNKTQGDRGRIREHEDRRNGESIPSKTKTLRSQDSAPAHNSPSTKSSKEKDGHRRRSVSSGSSSRSPSPHRNRSLSYSPAEKRQTQKENTSPQKSQSRVKSNHHRSKPRSHSQSSSDSLSPVRKKNSPKKQSRKSTTRSRSDSRSRSRKNKSRSKSHSARAHSDSRSRSSSYDRRARSRSSSRKKSYSRSRSRSHSKRRESRSPSIRRRHGSPSHLDKRRITSARKRPVPYNRPSPLTPSSVSSYDSYHRYSRSRSRSRTRYSSHSPSYSHRRKRSWSLSSSDSFKR